MNLFDIVSGILIGLFVVVEGEPALHCLADGTCSCQVFDKGVVVRDGPVLHAKH